MVLPAKLASAKCIVFFCLLFVLVFICFFSFVFVFDCLFNWSTEMAVLT